MLRHALVLLAAAVAYGAPGGCAPAAQVARINCEAPHQKELDVAPRGSGPLRLAAIYCQTGRSGSALFGAPLVSPDAKSIVAFSKDKLDVAWLDGGAAGTEVPAALGVFVRFGSNTRSVSTYAWNADSTFVWAGHHEPMKPSGWALAPLQPVQAGADGRLTPLPPLRHDAGPLDGLLWIGGEGLALAQFGTRGGYYRPEHDDPTPTLAMVDAAQGIVLDTLPFTAVDSLRDRQPRGASPAAFVRNAAATKRADGKIRALLDVGSWAVWTQGEPPRVLPDPYPGEFHNRMAIAPDGSRVLVGRLLRTAGGMCGRIGGCRPGTPVEGVLAALHDLETGQPLWSIRATVTQDYEFPTPAISPDGRSALVGLVPDGAAPLIALVALTDGKTLQTIPAPGGDYAMGFARGGRVVWTHAHGVTALYDVQP